MRDGYYWAIYVIGPRLFHINSGIVLIKGGSVYIMRDDDSLRKSAILWIDWGAKIKPPYKFNRKKATHQKEAARLEKEWYEPDREGGGI